MLDAVDEFIGTERLADECVGLDILEVFGIGGDHDDGDLREEYFDVFEEGDAASERHSEVGDDEVYFLAVDDADSLLPVGSLEQVVAELFQNADDLAPHDGVVFNDKYGAGVNLHFLYERLHWVPGRIVRFAVFMRETAQCLNR